MLSKRHYEAIAGIIHSLTVDRSAAYIRWSGEVVMGSIMLYRDELVESLASYFLEDNPRFDGKRFKAACMKEQQFLGGNYGRRE